MIYTTEESTSKKICLRKKYEIISRCNLHFTQLADLNNKICLRKNMKPFHTVIDTLHN